MSYIQRNNTHTHTHKPEERKYNPKKKNLFDARVTGFIPPSTVRFWFLRPRLVLLEMFWLDARRASLTADGPSTHTCRYTSRAHWWMCRTVEMDTAYEEQQCRQENFIQLVVVRQPERLGGRRWVNLVGWYVCESCSSLEQTNQKKRENSIFSAPFSQLVLFIFHSKWQ